MLFMSREDSFEKIVVSVFSMIEERKDRMVILQD